MVKLIGTLTEEVNPAGFGPTGLALLTASSAALSKLSSPEDLVTRSPDKEPSAPTLKLTLTTPCLRIIFARAG